MLAIPDVRSVDAVLKMIVQGWRLPEGHVGSDLDDRPGRHLRRVPDA